MIIEERVVMNANQFFQEFNESEFYIFYCILSINLKESCILSMTNPDRRTNCLLIANRAENESLAYI